MNDDIQEFNARQEGDDLAIYKRLAGLIDRELSDAEWKIWHAHPVWFLDDNSIVGYSVLTDCVRLLFWSGQSFEAEDLAPQGNFKAAEARYAPPDQIDEDALVRWLAESRYVQWDYKNIVERRGRLERLDVASEG